MDHFLHPAPLSKNPLDGARFVLKAEDMCVCGVDPWLEITAAGVHDRCLIHYDADDTQATGALSDLEKS